MPPAYRADPNPGDLMNSYTDRYTALKAQRAYSRAIAAGGIPALLEPYRVAPVPVVPLQRRRVVREGISA